MKIKSALLLWSAIACLVHAQTRPIPLDAANLKLTNVKAEQVTWKGRAALRVTDIGANKASEGVRYAIVAGTDFQDGVIEVDITGDTWPDADPVYRGFTGIAFRFTSDDRYEAFFLRTRNGRSEEQSQRNHSVQYMAYPDFSWRRLREEAPSRYETYVDLVPGEWNQMRIEVHGDKARLFVNGAAQPTMIVNDLKHGTSKGAIALWVGDGTVAHFSNLRVSRQ